MFFLVLSMADTPSAKRKIEELFEEYHTLMVYSAFRILGKKEDAEDAVFEAWERVIKNLEKINKIKCKETRNFLVIITERIAIDMVRRRTRETPIAVDEWEGSSYFATRDRNIEQTEFEHWLRGLPRIYSEVLLLYYVNGFSQREIGEILGVPENTVASRLMRARKILAEQGGI